MLRALGLLLCLVACRAAPAPSRRVELVQDAVGVVRADAKASVFLFTMRDCPISNRYAPEVRRLIAKYAPRGVDFRLVYSDPTATPEAIEAHLDEYEYTCAALRDPEHVLCSELGATVTPEACVLDANRTLVYRGRIDDRFVAWGKTRAAASRHDLADVLDALLAGEELAFTSTEAVGCFIPEL